MTWRDESFAEVVCCLDAPSVEMVEAIADAVEVVRKS
jgi:hypothetical protein